MNSLSCDVVHCSAYFLDMAMASSLSATSTDTSAALPVRSEYDDNDSSDSLSEPEDFQDGVDEYQFCQEREGPAGSPLFTQPVNSPSDLNRGDHVLYLVSSQPHRPLYRSALVTRHSTKKGRVTIISNGEQGVRKEKLNFASVHQIYKVVYTPCRYSSKMATYRAKWRCKLRESHYDPLYNSSHFFVTWCKTGKQYPLTHIINTLQYEEGTRYPLKPVLTRVPVQSLEHINPGDHLMIDSQHWLVKSTNREKDSFITYSCRRGNVVEEEKSFASGHSAFFQIDYDRQSNSYHAGQALESAHKAFSNKERYDNSDEFVTKMKSGTMYSIDERCLLTNDVEPVSCTRISVHTAVDVGDHIVVRDTFGQFRSVLVHTCLSNRVIISIPNLSNSSEQGQLDLFHYHEVYRINYEQCLSINEVFRRACSSEGEELLRSCGSDTSLFVSWAKVGRQISINVEKLTQNQTIAQVRPLQYQKVLSSDEICLGDHLFIPTIAYRWHFMVTECVKKGPGDDSVFKTIYCLRGSIQETEERLNPKTDTIYRITYIEEYPTDRAIARARSQIGNRKISPLARMWFVRWAKTGSEEGLEVDFLANESYPVSKSQICCFTQLNPGDYLVKEEKHLIRHHYIVLSVDSPTTCKVIETWKAKVIESVLTLDESTFYVLNYNEGVCLPPGESIRIAQDAVGSHLVRKYARRIFVNFLKTGNATESVDVENLQNDSVLLRREKVESALELKRGDHIECPIRTLTQVSYRNMIVVDTIDEQVCRVIHVVGEDRIFRRQKTVALKEEEVNIFADGEVFRVKYHEQIEPDVGMRLLQDSMARGNPENIDHEQLLLVATVGHPLSLQLNPELHKLLQCSKEDILKPMAIEKSTFAAEACARASLNSVFKLGTRAALGSTRIGRVVGFGPGVNILAETPFFVRRVYKLHRQHKFDQITEAEYKRGIVKQSFTSANTVIGATAGALIGQVAIPVPVVGAAVGGTLGAISGHGFGHLEGWAASKLVRESKTVTLPTVEHRSFSEFV